MAEFRFYILTNNKPQYTKLQLSNDELDKLIIAREKLLALLKLEDLYDQIIESFSEFKSQLYSNSLSLVSNFRRDYNANHEVRSKLNRQLFNTLNLSKLYLDKSYRECKDKNGNITKIKSFVKKITNEESLELEVKNFREEIYLNNPEYSLGCALRNLTQHDILPIQTYSIGINHNEKEDNRRILATFQLPLSKSNLLSCGIKPKVLKLFSETIDLHKVMDEYIYSLSQMHIKNRQLTESSVENSQEIFLSKTKEIEAIYGKSNFGIDVYKNNERIFDLELEWYEVVNYLQQKHAVAIDYRNIEHTTYL